MGAIFFSADRLWSRTGASSRGEARVGVCRDLTERENPLAANLTPSEKTALRLEKTALRLEKPLSVSKKPLSVSGKPIALARPVPEILEGRK